MRRLSRSKLDEATKIFVAHGATEVYLFGSYSKPGARNNSDVDFAVSGLPARRFFPALGEVMDRLGRPVDLVDLDKRTPFTDYLRANGELVRLG